jgi:hypothetical protein
MFVATRLKQRRNSVAQYTVEACQVWLTILSPLESLLVGNKVQPEHRHN